MVVLLDFDEDALDEPSLAAIDEQYRRRIQGDQHMTASLLSAESNEHERHNPNLGGFSAALACYPVVCNLAQHLDLNSLHDLAATCRQFHANLTQYRSQLVKQTLRCSNEPEEEVVAHGTDGRTRGWNGRLTSGRVMRCARDLVAECRRCGTVVCRNCTIKQPPASALSERYRRLCRPCTSSPLQLHTTHPCPTSPPTFTTPAFSLGHCICPDSVYLCLSCGNALRSSDTTYMRGWTWRIRYSTYLGGIGTGIGEGEAGVECGRGTACLAAREVEQEIDCDADELAELRREMERIEMEGVAGGRTWSGTSYLTQELEGIGGVMKKKVKKRVKVGMTVKEYEDERESGLFLDREKEGKNRSWCFWCLRVVLGKGDVEGEGEHAECGSAESSPASKASRTSC